MMDANSSPYAHNLVSSLYAMKELLESFLASHGESAADNGKPRTESQEVLRRAHTQAEEALRIAKRLGDVLATREDEGIPAVSSKASLKESWRAVRRHLQKEFDSYLWGEVEILERFPDPFPLLLCQPDDLREALYHLAKNSLQALKGKGRIVIRAQISFSTKEEPFVTLQVADTGPGIPEATLKRLFLPFHTTKPWPEGTGLGLYLTRQLVLRNQGRITASSYSGFGSTFTLEFPLAR